MRIAIKAGGPTILLCGLMIVASSLVFAETHPGDLKNGQKLYQQHCLKCHGARLDGKGPDAASLRVRPTDFPHTLHGSKAISNWR